MFLAETHFFKNKQQQNNKNTKAEKRFVFLSVCSKVHFLNCSPIYPLLIRPSDSAWENEGRGREHPPTSKPASSLQPRDINYCGVTSPNSHVPRSSGSLGLRTVNLGPKCSYRPRGTAILEHTEPRVHRQRAADFTVNMAGMVQRRHDEETPPAWADISPRTGHSTSGSINSYALTSLLALHQVNSPEPSTPGHLGQLADSRFLGFNRLKQR